MKACQLEFQQGGQGWFEMLPLDFPSGQERKV